MTDSTQLRDAMTKASATAGEFVDAMRRSVEAMKGMKVPVILFDSITPQHHRYMAAMAARQTGKSIVMEEMRRLTAAELRPQPRKQFVVIHDELFHAHAYDLEHVPPRDRSHFERGGRYRKPPIAVKATPPEPGMVQVRDRTGALVWRKIGKGKA